MPATTRTPVRQQGPLFVLLLTVFIDMVGFGIIIPFIPFWAERFDASPTLVTLLFSTFSFVAFLFSFFWGWVSDRWGRRPVLLMSLAGSVVSFAWLGFAEALWMLFAARAVGGAFGATVPVAQAYVADVTEPEQRAHGMGLIGAAFGLGFVLGPAIGGLLAGTDTADPNFRAPFFAAAGVSLISVLVGFVFLREPVRHEPTLPTGTRGLWDRLRSFSVVVTHLSVALPIAIVLMMSFAMGGLESTFALWTERAHHWGPRETGFFFAYIGVLLAITQGALVGLVTERFGEKRSIPVAVAVMALGMGTVPWGDTLLRVLASSACIAIGFGLANPMTNSLVSRSTPGDLQGAVLGVSQSGQSLCRIFGPITAGVLFDVFGRNMPYHVGGGILVAAVAVAVLSVAVVSPERDFSA